MAASLHKTDIKYVEIRQNRAAQHRAYVAGTRIRVQDIYIDSEVNGMTPDEIAAGYPNLSLAQIHAALAYYFDHREEIQEEIRQDRDFVAEMRKRTGPGPLERKLKGLDAEDDPLSS